MFNWMICGTVSFLAGKASPPEHGGGTEKPPSGMKEMMKGVYESQPEWLWLVLLVTAVLLAVGLLTAVVILRKNVRTMKKQAVTDPVTGILNGNGFVKEGQRYRLNAEQDSGLYILSTDIAGMRYYNDSFGYQAGTKLLKDTAAVLCEVFSDGVIGRYGGDRFYILTRQPDDRTAAELIHEAVKRIRLLSLNPGLVLNTGIYRDPGIATDLDYLMERANDARREIGGDIVNPVRFYNEDEIARKRSDSHLMEHIEYALEHEEFVCFLQPKYDSEKERICGAEALVRWERPGEELINPGRFINLLENNGMIGKLDRYMFRRVCGHMGERLREGKPVVPVSVNFSRVDFAEGTEEFVSFILSVLEENGLPRDMAEIEILESAVAASAQTKEVMEALLKEGVMVAIDDFGSGFSSLAMIKDVPFSILKLDRAFISDNCESERGQNLLACIQYYAALMGITTVCEGVETIKQLEFLKKIGCDYIQGYLFSRPVPEEEFYRKLEAELAEKGENPTGYRMAEKSIGGAADFINVPDIASALLGSFNRIARFDRDRDYYEILRDNAPKDCFVRKTGTMREYYEADQARIHPDDRIRQQRMLLMARDHYEEISVRNRCTAVVRRLNHENVYIWYEFELLPLRKGEASVNHTYIGVERILNESEIPKTE